MNMRRNRGLRSLKGYREGGDTSPPDTPATGASRALYGHEDISKRRQRRWEEQNRRRFELGPFGGRGLPLMATQWARDIIGAQVRDRLGLETLGNWIGSPDITAGDLTPSEYEALRETALRAMSQPERQLEGYGGNRWSLNYPDYGFSVTDPEHATNKAFEAIMGGYDIDYDHEEWGPLRGNKEAIDRLVEVSEGWNTVSNVHSPLATQTAAGKGPAVTSSDLYKTLRGAAGLIPRATDPSALLQQTLGRAAIIRDPDTGNYYIEDRYNWNPWTSSGREFNPFSREDWGSLREDLGEGEDVYDKARVLSEYFGSRSGEKGQEAEGSYVRINLGQLDDYHLDEAGRLAGGDVDRLSGAPSLASYLEDREEPTRFVSEEEEDGFQLSDIGEFVRRQGSRVMDFFDRPEEEEQPTRLVSEEEQKLSIPSAPAAIEIQDITQTPVERARRQHQRLMSGVRVPGAR